MLQNKEKNHFHENRLLFEAGAETASSSAEPAPEPVPKKLAEPLTIETLNSLSEETKNDLKEYFKEINENGYRSAGYASANINAKFKELIPALASPDDSKIMELQNLIGVEADGMIGPKTIAAFSKEFLGETIKIKRAKNPDTTQLEADTATSQIASPIPKELLNGSSTEITIGGRHITNIFIEDGKIDGYCTHDGLIEEGIFSSETGKLIEGSVKNSTSGNRAEGTFDPETGNLITGTYYFQNGDIDIYFNGKKTEEIRNTLTTPPQVINTTSQPPKSAKPQNPEQKDQETLNAERRLIRTCDLIQTNQKYSIEAAKDLVARMRFITLSNKIILGNTLKNYPQNVSPTVISILIDAMDINQNFKDEIIENKIKEIADAKKHTLDEETINFINKYISRIDTNIVKKIADNLTEPTQEQELRDMIA